MICIVLKVLVCTQQSKVKCKEPLFSLHKFTAATFPDLCETLSDNTMCICTSNDCWSGFVTSFLLLLISLIIMTYLSATLNFPYYLMSIIDYFFKVLILKQVTSQPIQINDKRKRHENASIKQRLQKRLLLRSLVCILCSQFGLSFSMLDLPNKKEKKSGWQIIFF